MRFEEILVLLTLITGLVSLVFIRYKKKNVIIDTCKSFFPVLAVVLLLRSFLFEPFRIPSGSMKPTLLVGDFILVNKFKYGFRLPVLGTKLIAMADPQVGDIVVFRGEKEDYIKRVIGVPGDRVAYINKKLYINDKEIPTQFVKETHDQGIYTVQKTEELPDLTHDIYIYPGVNRDHTSTDVVVPEGSYFVMGDNRDNSADSRRVGFINDKEIVGKAVATWMSWDSGVRWSRIGKKIT